MILGSGITGRPRVTRSAQRATTTRAYRSLNKCSNSILKTGGFGIATEATGSNISRKAETPLK